MLQTWSDHILNQTMSLRFFLDDMLSLWKSKTQWPLFDRFGNWYLGQVENTYKGPSSSSSLIWTSEFFSPKSGLVKACGAFLPLLSLLRILLRFDWMRGPWRWRTGSGSLTHPSVFPVSVTGNRGEGDTNTVNNSVVTCLLQNRSLSLPYQCNAPLFLLGNGKAIVRAQDWGYNTQI